ncbi:MAG: sulfurtransferase-like selenium metabolism protein YedF [Desulfobacterium sp.]|nr:sulfurtransferase-like selenium metabolism protein YedF [Desulfobacterium sp.]MBU3950405.1 sulfurtransferase-like selenium metabolism protein YedF [Pseudomonadota bacterium]MBU4037246.1 sulfurtransferase-like selenium metabolism protein YedF [Pseudomonadota bacterium]
MKKDIDARGLSCPAPVLQTKAAIDSESPVLIEVLVDNEAARQNVSRFLKSQKYQVSEKRNGSDYCISGKREGEAVMQKKAPEISKSQDAKIMVMVTTDRIGHGDDELGAKLMTAFLKTLKEIGRELWRLVFLNNGVKLTVDGAKDLVSLEELEKSGITILVCGTCLDHFKLLEKKKVGETTNMLDIVTSMQLADKVINI